MSLIALTPATPDASTTSGGLTAALNGGPIVLVALIVGAITIMYLAFRGARRAESSAAQIARELIAGASRIGIISGVLVITLGMLRMLSNVDGIVGQVTWGLYVFACTIVGAVAALFLARQFIAPPWWRLNNWNPDYDHAYDGSIPGLLTWIVKDALQVVRSCSWIDRAIIAIGVPALTYDLMAIIGVATVLQIVLTVLLVLYVGLGIALATANRIPRVLMSRLVELRHVSRQIACGDLSARAGTAELGDYEELAELVHDVNAMARSLQARESENQLLQHQLQTTLFHEQELATRDGLTQLRNRRYFNDSLRSEIDRCQRTGSYLSVAIIDLDNFKQVNDRYGHQEGDMVLQRVSAALVGTLRPYDLPARLGGEEFGVIFPETAPEEAKAVLERIMAAMQTGGAHGQPATFSGGIAAFPQHGSDVDTLYRLADEASYDAKLKGKARIVLYDRSNISAMNSVERQQEKARADAISSAKALVATVDENESPGHRHSELVGHYSAAIAQALGCGEELCKQMYMCGLLHDVGKIGLDDAIINKAGRLTEEEFEIVKQHPELSFQIVNNAGLSEIAIWVRHHHERWDGAGYPDGLSGEHIPLGARIVAVAEGFEVMTSNRVYRTAVEASHALDDLRSEANSKYDPRVVEALCSLVEHGWLIPGVAAGGFGAPASPDQRWAS